MQKLFGFILLMVCLTLANAQNAREIFQQNRDGICLVRFYQNISSKAKIGSYNKIKRNRIGLIVNDSGLVMVNADVYPVSMDIASQSNGSLLSGKPSDFKVKLSDGNEYDGRFLGKDDQAQMAFIQILHLPPSQRVVPVKFSSSRDLKIGDRVYLLELLPANYNFAPVFSKALINGVIPLPWRRFVLKDRRSSLSYGGLLLNERGAAVGVSVHRDFDYTPMGEYANAGNYLEIFPTEVFQRLIQNPPKLPSDEIQQKSWLGIRMQALSADLAEYWGIEQKGGIILNKVMPESPAEKAGLKTGDVLLAVNGVPLTAQKDEELSELRTIVRKIKPGQEVRLQFWRKGKVQSKNVRLVAAPKSISLAQKKVFKAIGVEIRELTNDVLFDENLPVDFRGVFVFQVDAASVAGLAGLRSGDIITGIDGRQVKDFEDGVHLLEKSVTGKKNKIMLQVFINRETRFIFLDMEHH